MCFVGCLAVYSNIKVMGVVNLITIIVSIMDYNSHVEQWEEVEKNLRNMEKQLRTYKTTLLKVSGGWIVFSFS